MYIESMIIYPDVHAVLPQPERWSIRNDVTAVRFFPWETNLSRTNTARPG